MARRWFPPRGGNCEYLGRSTALAEQVSLRYGRRD
jgi:hypothetical protein